MENVSILADFPESEPQQYYKKIAEKLFISPHTVRTHTSKIYEKLHVNSKAEAIKMAHKYKWV